MQRSIFLLIAAASITGIVLVGVVWFLPRSPETAPASVELPPVTAPRGDAGTDAVTDESNAPQPRAEAAVDQGPLFEVLPEPIPPEPLPLLADSDEFAATALAEVIDQPALRELFNLEQIVRRIVVTIDNLPREKLPQRLRPIEPPGTRFEVTLQEGESFIAATNGARYVRYVELFEALDTSLLLRLYRRLYPLCQQAYAELGQPNASFHQRVIEVIDHLLAAPPAPDLVRLVQPKVFYEFADPALQGRSAGQKLLLRIGNDHAARVKTRLREIRSALK
jgi:hypothetical protein